VKDRKRENERKNERKKARRVRVNEKLPIFAALRKERDPIFVFESGREKERERRRGENERLNDISPSPLNLARVRVYLAAGETAHGDDHVCSESNLYFPVWWCLVFFVQKKKKMSRSILLFTTLSLSLCAFMVHIHAYFITQKGLVLKPLRANVFVKTVLCAHTRYYFKTHELGGPVMASVHVNLA